MGRRRQQDEIAFGSDSFLDIVANIVGILIILIVIAGVRVSQMPADVPRENVPRELAEMVDTLPVVPETAGDEVEPTVHPAPPARFPSPPAPPVPIQIASSAPDPGLLARVDLLVDALADLRHTRRKLAEDAAEVQAAIAESKDQESRLQQAVGEEEQQLEDARRAIAGMRSSVEAAQRAIAGLELERAEAEAAIPPPQVLRHKLTPVGRVVQGEELHFLLSRGGVAVVPIDDLAKEVQAEFSRNRSQILRNQTRVGSVGPVRGFLLHYVMQRSAISLAEELQMGTTVVRTRMSEWRVVPTETAVFESIDEALRPQSRFLTVLRTAGHGVTLTYWTHPDSFDLYRELTEFAYDNGFHVAGRPLPDGWDIRGSPTHGTRSVAQ